MTKYPVVTHASCFQCNWTGAIDELFIPDGGTVLDEKCPECGGRPDYHTSPFTETSGVSSRSLVPVKSGKQFSGALYSSRSCYEGHKPLPLAGDLKVWGGSCIAPKVKKIDIYIGFDQGMTFTKRQFPWEDGHEILFRVRDGGAPGNTDQYKKLVAWAAEQIAAGSRVHAGCIGGHGRTGMFLAALVAHMGVSDDAVSYVRDKYCPKAVESKEQVDFLINHFGVKWAAQSKTLMPVSGGKKGRARAKYMKGGVWVDDDLPALGGSTLGRWSDGLKGWKDD